MAAKLRQAAARPARQRARALPFGGGAPLRLGVRPSARLWPVARVTPAQRARSERAALAAKRAYDKKAHKNPGHGLGPVVR